MANFCPQCGGKIEAGQTKCSFCGKDLSSLPSGNATIQYGSQNDSQNSYSQPGSTENQYVSPESNTQTGSQIGTGNQYVSQNTANQYSTQATNDQYGQNGTNQYSTQNGTNPYTNYQGYTSSYNYQPAVPPMGSQSPGANGLQITGLILGIISIVFCCCPYGALVLGIAGLVCSIIGNKENKH